MEQVPTFKRDHDAHSMARLVIFALIAVIASGSIGASAGMDFQENAVTYPQRGTEGTQSGVAAFRPGIDR